MSKLEMKTRALETNDKQRPVSTLTAYDRWLEEMGICPATGWRWRRDGLIQSINVLGRVYVSREAIAEFEQRAAAGAFAKVHPTPRKKRDPKLQ